MVGCIPDAYFDTHIAIHTYYVCQSTIHVIYVMYVIYDIDDICNIWHLKYFYMYISIFTATQNGQIVTWSGNSASFDTHIDIHTHDECQSTIHVTSVISVIYDIDDICNIEVFLYVYVNIQFQAKWPN